MDLDPTYIKARKTKAKAFSEEGDWESALREYQALKDASPGEPGIDREIRTAQLEMSVGASRQAGDNLAAIRAPVS